MNTDQSNAEFLPAICSWLGMPRPMSPADFPPATNHKPAALHPAFATIAVTRRSGLPAAHPVLLCAALDANRDAVMGLNDGVFLVACAHRNDQLVADLNRANVAEVTLATAAPGAHNDAEMGSGGGAAAASQTQFLRMQGKCYLAPPPNTQMRFPPPRLSSDSPASSPRLGNTTPPVSADASGVWESLRTGVYTAMPATLQTLFTRQSMFAEAGSSTSASATPTHLAELRSPPTSPVVRGTTTAEYNPALDNFVLVLIKLVRVEVHHVGYGVAAAVDARSVLARAASFATTTRSTAAQATQFSRVVYEVGKDGWWNVVKC
ncbi:hypothetical protein RI367_001567 [Sorochytrium milnesiophthora]